MPDFLSKFLRFPDSSNERLVYLAVLVLIGVALFLARKMYRRYLDQRLFFDPWANLSKDDDLNIGVSLSEMLRFELETIQDVHQRSFTHNGLWNEKSEVPFFEQASNGQQVFLGQVELLGLNGKLGKLLRLISIIVFFASPAKLSGSIHLYGARLRLQVTLRGRKDRSGRNQRSQGWKDESERKNLSKIPQMVSDMAHTIFMELSNHSGCSSAKGFRHFTEALRHHLEYNDQKDTSALLRPLGQFE